ncbi:MAG TPA: Dam family site-specific DNA-(adenine-N6)-methyltransferase [Candidatus Binataceae bacterium]|nr:Dam family site-specific DNA-(adenine-N6)-methyltransferase [Candidatus Binataceae bacterium]
MTGAAERVADQPELNLRPPLKWAGGKRWLVPLLQTLWAGHGARRLVEPLCGGLAVALGLMPERALLNDINPHTINFYRWLQRGLHITVPMANDEGLFYEYRRRFNWLISAGQGGSREAAALFYYLNRTCYNGLCRFNSRGEFNVPFGRYKSISYRMDFRAYSLALANWKFTCGDFTNLELEPADFIYADPPYDVEFRSYSKEGFSWDDQVRLAEWLMRHKGPVVLSNQATERIVKLYEGLGFRLLYADAPRMISCSGDRARVREVIALKDL